MKRLFYRVWSKFLDIFGDIRFSWIPPFFFYEPEYFAVSGEKIYDALKFAKPGDILLHAFDAFLCTKFIPSVRGYSHGGLYIGDNKVIHATAEGVNMTSLIEFAETDRLCILRPKKGAAAAVKLAKKYLKEGISYDFLFSEGDDSLYCFELCCECYPKLTFPKKVTKMLLGLIRRKVWTADSFFDSKDVEVVWECNPKLKIDYKKKTA